MRRTFLWEIVVVITVMFLPALVFASKVTDDAQKEKMLNKAYRMQIPFIENRGQIENEGVIFYAKTSGGTLFVEKDVTLTYSLPDKNNKAVVLKEILTDKKVEVIGIEPSPTRVNYFKGNDRSKWKTNIPSYNSVSFGEIYKGIDLKLRAYGNNVEKLFTVLSGGNPEIIKIKLQGAKKLEVNKKGELEVITELGPVTFTKPLAYQEIDGKRVEVGVAYNIQKSGVRNQESKLMYGVSFNPKSAIQNPKLYSYGFNVGNYNKNYPLIIDPLLASTFIGGNSNDFIQDNALAIDSSDNVFVAGWTISSDYPTTIGAYDESLDGNFDVFVSKLNSELSSLLASTFLGGGGEDYSYALAIDSSDDVLVTGETASSDYPTTSGAYDESFNSNFDVFVSKLNNDLSSLLASTFIGEGSAEGAYALAIDSSNNIFVAGWTDLLDSPSNYPTTTGAYDESYNGSLDVIVSKLNNDLSSLLASTFLGGGNSEYANILAIDSSNNIFVAGSVRSSDYPTTSGTYDESYNGGDWDGFVSKLNSNLSSLLASTFLGGDDEDSASALAIDSSNNIFVAGRARSSNYPTTSGAYDESLNGSADVIVSKLNSDLSSLLASTFLGGSSGDFAHSLAIDSSNNIFVAGWTNSSNYPTTTGVYDESLNGSYDVIISKFNPNLSSLLASTFLGGVIRDWAHALAIDSSNNIFVAGRTNSSDYPTIIGAYDESHNSNFDVFVSKLTPDLSDDDDDGIPYNEDNCPDHPNGPDLGTCVKTVSGVVIGIGVNCTDDGDCESGETCQLEQGDYNSNGIGDACECYADLDCDDKVGLSDLVIMKGEFGRTDCAVNPCQADITGDDKVNLSDLVIMKAQFGRTNCPACL